MADENRLGPTEENDIIWDGLFPVFDNYTDGTTSDDENTIYSIWEAGGRKLALDMI